MSDSLTAGGVNANIPLQAGRGVAQNPLAASPGEFVNTLNSFNQLKLFPLQQQHMQLANQGQDIANKTAQLQQNLTQLNAAGGLMLPLLLGKDGKPTTSVDVKDIARGLADAAHIGLMPAQQAAAVLQTLPDAGQDPVANLGWLKRLYAENRAAAGQHEAALAQLGMTPAVRDNGQSVISGAVAGPLTRQPGQFVQSGQPTQVYPTRAQEAQPVTYKDAHGVEQQTTLGEYNRRLGNGEQLGPAKPVQGTSNQSPGEAAAFPPGYNGRLPQQPTEGAGGSIPGPPPTLPASVDQYNKDRQIAGTLGQRIFPLKQQIDLLSDTDTGPGSETANWFRSALISAANQGALPKSVTPNDIQQAKFDELKKYMAQYITGQPFAAGSDARMAEMVSGSPNATLSTLANKDVAKVLIGMERFRSAPYLAFQMEHKGNGDAAAADYAKFAADFSKNYDPRAFAVDLMGGWNSPKVKEMFSKMGKPGQQGLSDEQKKFIASLKMAYSIPGLLH